MIYNKQDIMLFFFFNPQRYLNSTWICIISCLSKVQKEKRLDFQNVIFNLKHIFHILCCYRIRDAEDSANCGIHFQHRRSEKERVWLPKVIGTNLKLLLVEQPKTVVPITTIKKKKIYVQIQYGQKAHGRDVFTKEKPQKHNISAEWC